MARMTCEICGKAVSPEKAVVDDVLNMVQCRACFDHLNPVLEQMY